jgi:hypothetical protein
VTITVSLRLADAAGTPAISVPAKVVAAVAAAAAIRLLFRKKNRDLWPALAPDEPVCRIGQPPLGAYDTSTVHRRSQF